MKSPCSSISLNIHSFTCSLFEQHADYFISLFIYKEQLRAGYSFLAHELTNEIYSTLYLESMHSFIEILNEHCWFIVFPDLGITLVEIVWERWFLVFWNRLLDYDDLFIILNLEDLSYLSSFIYLVYAVFFDCLAFFLNHVINIIAFPLYKAYPLGLFWTLIFHQSNLSLITFFLSLKFLNIYPLTLEAIFLLKKHTRYIGWVWFIDDINIFILNCMLLKDLSILMHFHCFHWDLFIHLDSLGNLFIEMKLICWFIGRIQLG